MADERARLSEILPRYELGSQLGRGAWGVVWEAQHRTLRRRVAIKQLPGAFSSDPSVRDRFRSEAQVVASLDHPHIVPVFDFAERDDVCVFVMELMSGGTLWERFSEGRLGREAACGVCVAVLGALAHAHRQGILHRDVKPDNVLFNENDQPKLADFGIAKLLGEGAGTRTATGMVMGTPAYMAPEQGMGQEVGPTTDVYAVGAMLYELLAGRPPFESTGAPMAQLYRHVNEAPVALDQLVEVPAALSAVVMRALEKDPADRHDSADAFAAALDAAATGGFGAGWIARSGIAVLASGPMLERAEATSDTPAPPASPDTFQGSAPPALPPAQPDGPPGPDGSSGPVAPTPPPAPVAAPPGPSASVGPQPSPPSHAAGGPPGLVSPAPPSGPPTGWPSPAPRTGRRVLVATAIVAGVLAAVAAAGVVVVMLAQNGGDVAESPQEPSDAAPDAPSAGELEAAESRFETACERNNVPDALCGCALETARDELTPQEFMDNDRVLRDTGDGLTAQVEAIFARCQEELG